MTAAGYRSKSTLSVLPRQTANMTDPSEDKITQEEMLSKIAELNHSSSHLKGLNASMMQWLDAAESEIVTLNSDNKSLRTKVNMLEKIVTDTQEDRGEPHPPPPTDDKPKTEQRMRKMEEQLTLMKEHNKRRTSELKDLQQERDQDRKSLGKMSHTVHILQAYLEEAQLELQQKDKVIEEKNLVIRIAEETLEEFSNTIEHLRTTSHKLKLQLEERQDESSFTFLNELVEDKIKGFPTSGMSYAEEVMQLGTLAVETKDAGVLVDPWSFSADFQQQYTSDRFW
uniref:Uncharacterized protein n=1 Tax=Tetraodon nigroviridis TaxID=99883 RepID=H3DHA7_TETNG